MHINYVLTLCFDSLSELKTLLLSSNNSDNCMLCYL